MTITKNSVVSLNYTLTDDEGEILDSSEGMGPLDYIHGQGNLIPGLEKDLEGKKAGDTFKTTIEPQEAYGEVQEDFVVVVERNQFPDDVEIEVGMQFEAGGPDGSRLVTVTEVDGEKITVDANHPLAGERLHFDVTVVAVRDATEEEIANGLEHSCGCGDDCGCDDDCGSGGCGGCGCGH